jgi:hypothetical protein
MRTFKFDGIFIRFKQNWDMFIKDVKKMCVKNDSHIAYSHSSTLNE